MKTTFNNSYLLLYDVALVSTLFTLVHGYSSFGLYNSIVTFLLRYVAIFFSLIAFVLSIQKYKKADSIYIFLSLFLVLIVGYMSEDLVTLWLSYVVIIGARDVSFKHIVKVHLFSMSFFCLTNMLAYEMGWTDNASFNIEQERESVFGDVVERKRYGYLAGTDYANHVIFILIDYWLLKEGRFNILEYFVYAFFGYFIFVNCDARLATVCIFSILCFSPIANFLRMQKDSFCLLIRWLLVLSIPLFAVGSLYTTFAYDEANIDWVLLDTFLSGRLTLSQDALQKYGIPWFGQFFVLYGTGNEDISNSYDYVDSSYVQYYLRWGWILTSFIIYAFFKIGKQAMKRNDVSFLLSLFLAGMVGVFCQFLFHLGYCIMILALCASHYDQNINRPKIEYKFK